MAVYFLNSSIQKHPKERQVWIVTGTKPFTQIINNFKSQAYLLDHQYFYPVSFHQNNLNIKINQFKKKYPKAIMLQYGYTTNNILHKNCIKNFIEQ